MPKKCDICCTVLTNYNCRNLNEIPYCKNCESNMDSDYDKPKKKEVKDGS